MEAIGLDGSSVDRCGIVWTQVLSSNVMERWNCGEVWIVWNSAVVSVWIRVDHFCPTNTDGCFDGGQVLRTVTQRSYLPEYSTRVDTSSPLTS